MSKHKSLSEVYFPYELPCGSVSFMDYSFNRNNRFSTPEMIKKNRFYSPSCMLHYWNAPPNITAADLSSFLVNNGATTPEYV